MRTELSTIINENPNLILQVTASDLRYFLDDLIFEIRSMTLAEAKEIKRGDSLLTINEAAELLSVSKMTLHRWDKNGILKKVEIGGKRRYRKSDINRLAGCKI